MFVLELSEGFVVHVEKYESNGDKELSPKDEEDPCDELVPGVLAVVCVLKNVGGKVFFLGPVLNFISDIDHK